MKENWKDIKDFEGYYQVSNLGRVKSLRRKRITGGYLKERILKFNLQTVGYYTVTLYKNGVISQRRVHRLVTEAFILNVFNKPCVNHKSGIKIDNEVENLEWCTYSENEKHAYSSLGKTRHRGYKKLCDTDIKQIKELKAKGLSKRSIAKMFNVVHSTIGYYTKND